MGRYFWQPILGWFAGIVLASIITSIIFKIGWKNPLEILIWGYAMIGSASVFAWQVFRAQRKDDKKELEDKLKSKADVKDIDRLNCQIETFHDTLQLIAKSQEEVHTTVEHIWDKLSK